MKKKPSGRVPSVLIVEDYRDTREMYADYLEFAGYRVEQAENGFEALAKAVDMRPDVILMDLALPRMDGWEATRRLKRDERTRRIPVIALTGHALERHAAGAISAGCDAFVTKPCLPDDLLVEIQKVLDRHTSRRPVAAGKPKQIPAATATRAPVGRRAVLITRRRTSS